MSNIRLPDECLLYIFNLLYDYGTLLNFSEVCERWKYLVFERLRNVAYLSNELSLQSFPASKTILFEDSDKLEISKWFPNLKILALHGLQNKNIVENLKVKGLVLRYGYSYQDLQSVDFRDSSLEMIATTSFYNFFANDIQGPKISQLYLEGSNVSDFDIYAKYFPNLKRLHISKFTRYPSSDNFYTGPVLEKLEILEICCHVEWEQDGYFGFSLADQCPALKSAFHFIQTDEDLSHFIMSGIKNYFLEDLVFQFEEPQDWSILRRILSKYPKLKHLAIRGDHDTGISDGNVPELLELLPHIILIDIRNSVNVTEKSVDYIDRYCKKNDREISFYYQKRPKITKKWPHLLTKSVCIGRGFDFMKYCFLRNYNSLPALLDPDE